MSQETQKRGGLNNTPPLGKLYDIGGGRWLMLHHAGSGTPAVVIEAGGGAFGLDYYNIFQLCAQHTTCVLYDRAGSGWSDPVDGLRSAALQAELHFLGQDRVQIGDGGGGVKHQDSLGHDVIRGKAGRTAKDTQQRRCEKDCQAGQNYAKPPGRLLPCVSSPEFLEHTAHRLVPIPGFDTVPALFDSAPPAALRHPRAGESNLFSISNPNPQPPIPIPCSRNIKFPRDEAH